MRVHNKQELYSRRKKLRTEATPQEAMIWGRLRKNKLGYRFRRQQSIGWYIVDFYCPEKKLAIEIDGSQHIANKEYDTRRTEFLNLRGVSVLRFWDSEVDENIDGVVRKILISLSTCP
ncbi:MAG: protein of unknown function DUF559 [Parcubacteria group bacterium Gr01-1014_17]|nr:MAG: protein of unknown function DUF559 [Parcubacteria group bacterium Gr01-1014_17]